MNTSPNWATAPSADECEVSVFGPGYGEGILIHLGNNEWMVIDSCIDPATDRPVSLDYLEAIDVDPATAVKVILATHWHDDHIAGLDDVVIASPNASFFFSSALKTVEFLTMIKAADQDSLIISSGSSVFSRIITAFEERVKNNNRPGPQAASAYMILWRDGANRVEALSPGADAYERSLREIASLMPEVKTAKRRLVNRPLNETSVVALVVFGDCISLLGADLQELGSPVRGWSEIIESDRRPRVRAKVFKVPHHGAANAHHPGIWTDLLDENPIAVLTPFIKGLVSLPTEEDRARVRALSDQSFVTNPSSRRTPPRRTKVVEKLLRQRKHPIIPLNGDMGQVRCRKVLNSDIPWSVERFGAADVLRSTG